LKKVIIILSVISGISAAEISGDTIAEYLDMIGEDMVYDRDGNEFVLMAVQGDTTVPYMYILADPEMEGVLLVALTPGVIPESGPERTTALETLAQLNWDNTWVKFTADPETGEVSAMYTFSTENGLGFEAFSIMIKILLGTVDENWETLASL